MLLFEEFIKVLPVDACEAVLSRQTADWELVTFNNRTYCKLTANLPLEFAPSHYVFLALVDGIEQCKGIGMSEGCLMLSLVEYDTVIVILDDEVVTRWDLS